MTKITTRMMVLRISSEQIYQEREKGGGWGDYLVAEEPELEVATSEFVRGTVDVSLAAELAVGVAETVAAVPPAEETSPVGAGNATTTIPRNKTPKIVTNLIIFRSIPTK